LDRESLLSLSEIDIVLRDVRGFLFSYLIRTSRRQDRGRIAVHRYCITDVSMACLRSCHRNDFTVACLSGTLKYLQIRSAKSRLAEPLKIFNSG